MLLNHLSSLLLISFLIETFIFLHTQKIITLCVCVCVCTPQLTCMEVQGQLARVNSLLSCGLWKLSVLCSKHLPNEPPCHPNIHCSFTLEAKKRAGEWEEEKEAQGLLLLVKGYS